MAPWGGQSYPFVRCRNWGSSRWSDLPKVTHLGSGRAGTRILALPTPKPRPVPPTPGRCPLPRLLISPEDNLLLEQQNQVGKHPTPPSKWVREGRLMGWLPLFPWLPVTKYIFFLIGLSADGYLASWESERDFVSNAEKWLFRQPLCLLQEGDVLGAYKSLSARASRGEEQVCLDC